MEAPAAARMRLSERYLRLDEGQGGAIASGSFGRVYLAMDQLTQQPVAVKRQPAGHRSCAREMAVYEVFRAFPHDNILLMLDRFVDRPAGSDSPCVYIVFEYCPTSLWHIFRREPLAQHGLLEMATIARHLQDISRGLSHLHGLGMAHGDLSMKNILVDAHHRCKIADFGTACEFHKTLKLQQ